MTTFEEKFEKEFEKELEKGYEKVFKEEEEKFENILKSKLVISLIGDVNVGKSETINALTGRRLSEVGPYAGLTKTVSLHKFSENVVIADTPGLDDINTEMSKRTKDFVDKDADIIIFFMNAAVGASKNSIDTFHSLKKLNKPIIIVLNKIDIWYESETLVDKDDYETVINQIEKETNQKVIPISAKKRINIKNLNNEITSLLESSNKDILFLKVSKYKEDQVKVWINGATVAAFGVGAIPIPGSDIIPLTALQVSLALKIAYIYNCEVNKEDVMSLLASTVTGNAGKQLFKLALQALKALGWLGGPLGAGAVAFLAGVIAGSITYGFGWACNAYYKSGKTIDLESLGEIYKVMYQQYFNDKVKKTQTNQI
jgi:GTP-binding protein Era